LKHEHCSHNSSMYVGNAVGWALVVGSADGGIIGDCVGMIGHVSRQTSVRSVDSEQIAVFLKGLVREVVS